MTGDPPNKKSPVLLISFISSLPTPKADLGSKTLNEGCLGHLTFKDLIVRPERV